MKTTFLYTIQAMAIIFSSLSLTIQSSLLNIKFIVNGKSIKSHFPNHFSYVIKTMRVCLSTYRLFFWCFTYWIRFDWIEYYIKKYFHSILFYYSFHADIQPLETLKDPYPYIQMCRQIFEMKNWKCFSSLLPCDWMAIVKYTCPIYSNNMGMIRIWCR